MSLSIQEEFSNRIETVKNLVKKTNKSSVLIIQQFPKLEETRIKFPKVRESISNILAFIELRDLEVLALILSMADGVFDHIAFDSDIKLPVSNDLIAYATKQVQRSKLFFYSDMNVWADSALQFILQQEKGLQGKRVFLSGEGLLHTALSQKLSFLGVKMIADGETPIDVVLGCAIKNTSLDESIVPRLAASASFYDIGIGNFSHELIEKVDSQGHPIYRIDIRAGISSLVIHILETDYLIHKVMGKATIKNTEFVAGGIMGKPNAVILDDIHHPSSIIGIADGKGHIKTHLDTQDLERLAFAERLIEEI